MRSPFGMTRPSGSSEAARRANLEEAGHENNILQEENDMTMRFDTEKRKSQRMDYPLNVVETPIKLIRPVAGVRKRDFHFK
jgi:hypothetical protein